MNGPARIPALLSCLVLAAGCAVLDQEDARIDHTDIALDAGDLARHGLGFLTPAAATGSEADKQSLALSFAKVLERMYPEVRVVPLPSILSAVNAAELDQQYKQMYRDYLETGILDGSLLTRIGRIGGVRYLAQLNLASFQQQTRGRWSLLGLRLIDTKQGNMRVFIQIWDSRTGAVAWEGGGELNYAYETSSERPVTFQKVAETAAERIYEALPRSGEEPHRRGSSND